jgi:hypothetical protein
MKRGNMPTSETAAHELQHPSAAALRCLVSDVPLAKPHKSTGKVLRVRVREVPEEGAHGPGRSTAVARARGLPENTAVPTPHTEVTLTLPIFAWMPRSSHHSFACSLLRIFIVSLRDWDVRWATFYRPESPAPCAYGKRLEEEARPVFLVASARTNGLLIIEATARQFGSVMEVQHSRPLNVAPGGCACRM